MVTKEFIDMKGLTSKHEVTVNALELQKALRELEELKRDKSDMKELVQSLREELTEKENSLEVANKKLESCYADNDKLYKDVIDKSDIIRKLSKEAVVLKQASDKTSKILRENKSLRSSAEISQALLKSKNERLALEKYANPSNNFRVELKV